MNELPESMYDYREDLNDMYIEEDEPEVAGACVECGETIYTHQEYYFLNRECVCENCINEYIEQFKVERYF